MTEAGKTSSTPVDLSSAELDHVLKYIQSQRYDVFLSFVKEDLEFAEEVSEKIKLNTGLEVLLPSEGYYAALTRLLEFRCKWYHSSCQGAVFCFFNTTQPIAPVGAQRIPISLWKFYMEVLILGILL